MFPLFLSLLFLYVPLAASAVQAQGDRTSEVIQRVNALRSAKNLPVYQVPDDRAIIII